MTGTGTANPALGGNTGNATTNKHGRARKIPACAHHAIPVRAAAHHAPISCLALPAGASRAKPCPLLPATGERRAARDGRAISSCQEMLSHGAFAVHLQALRAMPSPLGHAAGAEAGPSADPLPTLSKRKVCGAALPLKEPQEV